MTTFIWDLDGTLINSYEVILHSLGETFRSFKIPYDLENARTFILNQSVVELLKQTSKEFNIPYVDLKNFFSERSRSKNSQVMLMDGALEVLKWTKKRGIINFVYTHKSDNALKLLKRLEIKEYFSEIVTSSNGFQRKPNPEAIRYLMAKYHLPLDKTYYIGDRRIDVDVAINAKIKSINLTQPSSESNVIISRLTDIFNQTKVNVQI